MAERPTRLRRWLTYGAAAFVLVLAIAAYVFRDDIFRTALDPKVPFQTYEPPKAPDYGSRNAWSLLPTEPGAWTQADPPADVFFVSPTTYEGGRHWNSPIGEEKAERYFRRVMAPNYAGPFVRVGRIFAPRYRQASLYTLLTLRDDARDARRFAYGDVANAFRAFRDRYNKGRPFVIVGVEQGATLAARLVAEEVAPNGELKRRMAAAYLVEGVVADDAPPGQPCATPTQTGCVAAWVSAFEGDLERGQDIQNRSLIWGAGGQLENLQPHRPLCFNPLLGAISNAAAPARLNLGAANATGLEWGARPAFLTRQVGAQCQNGVLRISRPKSQAFKPIGSWADRQKAPGYNLFYADLEADAERRVKALLADPDLPRPAPPIVTSTPVAASPIKRID